MFGNDIAISEFLTGLATAYFALQAYQLLHQKAPSRLQKVLAVIFIQWAIFNLKDFILTINGYDAPYVQGIITLIDGISLIGYTSLLYELIQPRWATWGKAISMLLAYTPCFMAYMLWPSNVVILVYTVLLILTGIIIFLLWIRKAHEYVSYIRENYSNIDELDISWLRVAAWFFVVCQLAWVVISIIQHPLVDGIYYVSSIIMWQFTLEHILHQKPIVINLPPPAAYSTEDKKYPFADKLEVMIKEEQPYLIPTLSLKEMATRLGTNRTYLSDYITRVLGTTFYDYINKLRIEEQSLALMKEHPDYTLERIATESGFQSLSTFRRAFMKQKGIAPSEYRRKLHNT